MTSAWVVYGLVIGGLIAVAAWALEGTCRIAERPVRWVWTGGLVLMLALIGLAPYRNVSQSSPAAISERVAPTSVVPHTVAVPLFVRGTPPRSGAAEWLRSASRTVTSATHGTLTSVQRNVPAWVDRYFAAAWLLLSATLLALFAAVSWHFHRLRRRWPAARLCGSRVQVTAQGGPAVVGVFRPTIVVPHWLLGRSAEEQRLVLAHEEEHLRAHDPLLLTGACVIAVLLPWHPAVWWMLSRLRLAVELDCDMRVLRRGVAPRTYGTLLIDLAGRCAGLPIGAPALADTPSHLQRRLLAMKPLRLPFARARGASLGAFAVIALVLACAAQVPAARAQVKATGVDTTVIVTDPSTNPPNRMSYDTVTGRKTNVEMTGESRFDFYKMTGESRFDVYEGSHVDEAVQPISIPTPRYPPALQGAGVSGQVEMQYIVDTSGHAEPNSFKVLNQTDEAFVAPAEEAILKGVFKPAKFRGHLVRQLVQQSISFRTGQSGDQSVRPPAQLDELVTTAIGQRRRQDLGNDITTIRADSVLQHAPIRHLTDLLQDSVPGLTVEHTSGAPGDPAKLRLRGLRSAFRSNDPVVIVDGARLYAARVDTSGSAPAPSPLDLIDPNIIEKIEVFKGPSAATLYGADAANGVIVITTKRKP